MSVIEIQPYTDSQKLQKEVKKQLEEHDMNKAMETVNSTQMTLSGTAARFGVSRETLPRSVMGKSAEMPGAECPTPLLSVKEKCERVEACQKFTDCGVQLTSGYDSLGVA